MSQVEVEVAFHVTLTPAEYRLITLALSGRLENPHDLSKASKDKRAALALNQRLCEQRARHAQDLHQSYAGAAVKAAELAAAAPEILLDEEP